uniref:Hyaluronan/mRNA-binding protein domain-containing protein n=1 Tax=Helicotheca tamesis TaxID=374047 RepID=A0A7S2HER4_9STRA|eukprot:CAMPEP_0185731268 /NCGR_PEP_ID=MMETSP1171-20130828/12390_1 /TAXON_ID=374046 /ORGANISM="Helicotheca tamensis, Strain CCMP826" /LENGTH=287 /DNA_ID=CAMNT_0028400499 /DNA_START=86 /DNA_END=949 /DNA_ORIENTATION=+
MSKNFFGVLDDSDDEGERKKVAPAKAEKKEKPKKVAPVAEPSKTDNRRRKEHGHGDRGTKQGRGGRPPARDGKRTYDRRSGTGRGREIKKGGGGARNWGSDKNDAKKAEGAVTEGEEGAALEAMPEEEPKDETEKSEEAPAEEEGAEEKVEEKVEDKTMTYDEYMASKETPDTEAFKTLAVKEVENEFAGVAARKRTDDEDFLVMGGGKALRKKGGKKKEKETLVASFRVADQNSGERRGRDRRDGDRRGGRGGRGNRERGGRYGSGRGGQRSKNIDVSDADAFPSL